MKKQKKKIILIIMILIILFIVLGLIHTIRNFIIINNLQKNIEAYVSKNEFYIKTSEINNDNMNTTFTDYYKKDNKEFIFLEKNKNGEITVISEYITDEKSNIYIDTEESAIAKLGTQADMKAEIPNLLKSNNFFIKLFNSMISNIKKTEYNEKPIYLISNFLSTSNLFDNSIIDIYVEKDTGLCVRTEDGAVTTEIEYNFDNIDEAVFYEPNIEDYQVQE